MHRYFSGSSVFKASPSYTRGAGLSPCRGAKFPQTNKAKICTCHPCDGRKRISSLNPCFASPSLLTKLLKCWCYSWIKLSGSRENVSGTYQPQHLLSEVIGMANTYCWLANWGSDCPLLNNRPCTQSTCEDSSVVWEHDCAQWSDHRKESLKPFTITAHVCARLCLTLCDPIDCSPPGSSVHGISQASILEWVAVPSSRGSSGIEPTSPAIGRWIFFFFFNHWIIWEASYILHFLKESLRIPSPGERQCRY